MNKYKIFSEMISCLQFLHKLQSKLMYTSTCVDLVNKNINRIVLIAFMTKEERNKSARGLHYHVLLYRTRLR